MEDLIYNSHRKVTSNLTILPDTPKSYTRQASPSTVSLKNFEAKAQKLREEVQFSSQMNRVRIIQTILESMQDDMIKAVDSIKKLNLEKAKYRDALKEVNSKKEDLFQKATFYYNDWKNQVEINSTLKKTIAELEDKNSRLLDQHRESESTLSKRKVQVEHMKYDLHKLDKLVRDRKIDQDAWEELIKSKKSLKAELDSLKAERSNVMNQYTESFKGSPLLHKITKMSEKLLMKIKEYSELHILFSNKICKSSEFRLFVMKQNWEECLYKLLQFILEIISYQSANPSRNCTPSPYKIAMTQTDSNTVYSPFKSEEIRNGSSGSNYDRFYSFNCTVDTRPSANISSDQLLDTLSIQNDRLARLNHQIYQTMTSSKKLLNISPMKLSTEFSEMRDSFDSLKSPYSVSFDKREGEKTKGDTILEASLPEEEEKTTVKEMPENSKPKIAENLSPKIKQRNSLIPSKTSPKLNSRRKPISKFDEYVSPVLRKGDGWGSVGAIFTMDSHEAKEKDNKDAKQVDSLSGPNESNKE